MMTTDTIAEAIFYADFTDQMYRDALDNLIIALDEKERAEQRRLTAIEDRLVANMMQYWQRFYDNQTPAPLQPVTDDRLCFTA